MSLHVDALAELIASERDDNETERLAWETALDIVYGRRLQAEVEETIVDNAKIEAAFQNSRDIVGNVIVPDEHDPRL